MPPEAGEVLFDYPSRADPGKPQPEIIIHRIIQIQVKLPGFFKKIFPEKDRRL
jgi:hypothetical protein